MSKVNIYTEKLFSYGTLRYEAVQLSIFGRKLEGMSDALSGYKLIDLEIKDPAVLSISGEAVHSILIHTGKAEDQVSGTVFDISARELQLADQYEIEDYKRIRIQLLSGTYAWVYADRTLEKN